MWAPQTDRWNWPRHAASVHLHHKEGASVNNITLIVFCSYFVQLFPPRAVPPARPRRVIDDTVLARFDITHDTIFTLSVKKWLCLLQANINGRVLSQCNLDELKKEMEMNFGDWQLFRGMVRVYLSLQLAVTWLLCVLCAICHFINGIN